MNIYTSPLAVKTQQQFRMNTHEAETRYPSLRGQCIGRDVCRFTMKDLNKPVTHNQEQINHA